MAWVWYWYCAIWWEYTMFLRPNRASVKGIVWLAKGFERVSTKTGTIPHLTALISIPLGCISWLYWLLNRAKPGYGGIIAQSWLNLAILECGSSKDVTQSIERLSIRRWKVSTISGTMIVVGEMHFIFQTTPSEVPTAWSSRYYLASRLSVSSPWVASIIFWKYTH